MHPQPHAFLEVFATVLAAVALLLVMQPPVEIQTRMSAQMTTTPTGQKGGKKTENTLLITKSVALLSFFAFPFLPP